MTREFAERYYNWLCKQVIIEGKDHKDYDGLFRHLHAKDFVWIVPNDDNRIGDVYEMRREFWGEGNRVPKHEVSMLEVIVALSRRLEFIAGGEKEIWAGQLLKNTGLDKMYDPVGTVKTQRIEAIIEALIWRLYDRDGTGGFFPLRNPKEDQTKVEIWYQMNAYVIEHTID